MPDGFFQSNFRLFCRKFPTNTYLLFNEQKDISFAYAKAEGAPFALLFEFDGDVKKIRHVLYNCTAARPSIESATNEDEIEVQTEKLSLTASPLQGGYVKARTSDTTTEEAYNGWYDQVYLPTDLENGGKA